jgi:HPt (histidine-containing phosphotransfer) domain-containing protein
MSRDDIHAAIMAVWQRNLPQVRDRLSLLQRAAGELEATGTVEAALRDEALAAAHKLAGSLGMFGYQDGTLHARRIEQLLDPEKAPAPQELSGEVRSLCETLAPAFELSKTC